MDLKTLPTKIKKLYQRLKLWYHERFVKNVEILMDMMERRDEVIKRSIAIANKTYIPPFNEFGEVIEWIISPHLYREWYPFKNIQPETSRVAELTTYKIMEKREEVENNEQDKEINEEI